MFFTNSFTQNEFFFTLYISRILDLIIHQIIHILFQFLFESIALCLLGGILALGLIYALFYVVNTYADMSLGLVLSWSNIFLGLLLSFVVGIFSGIIPAYNAAKMHPVEAIAAV